MRNISVKYFEFGSGLGDVILDISYLELWQPI